MADYDVWQSPLSGRYASECYLGLKDRRQFDQVIV